MLTAGTLAAIAVLKISGRVAERRPRTMAARPERGLKQPGAQVKREPWPGHGRELVGGLEESRQRNTRRDRVDRFSGP
ncbi:unnamed protein product [Heligmosomoides polygyrus]|uniref:Secreted protein n=1 Tax=Heligmosomoides polygyrus TaxID=6339 RepID=A0A183FJK2_HELPZ|nr:unnamed protein product [Heligmosomoides polygyrus]